MDTTFRIFTDGSAIGNPGPGGWGAVLILGRKRWEMSGASSPSHQFGDGVGCRYTGTSRATTWSAGRVRSDSEYLIYGMRVFVFRWQKQGWRNRRGGELQNRELWTELIDLNAQLRVKWRWLRGHNGHPIQKRADALAYREARELWQTQRSAAA